MAGTVVEEALKLRQNLDELYNMYKHSVISTIDDICPAFSESGSVVTCEPLEGYPLKVTSDETATKITQCGKNLVAYPYTEKTKTMNGITFTNNGDGSITINGTATDTATFFFANKKAWCVKPGVSYVGKLHKLSGSYSGVEAPAWAVNYYSYSGASYYLGWLWVAVGSPHSLPCPNSLNSMAAYIVVKAGVTCNNYMVKPQLEAGTVATEYEPYKESKTFAPGKTIPAISGLNTLYADSGDITVTGRADPNVVIERLTQKIIDLGGTV